MNWPTADEWRIVAFTVRMALLATLLLAPFGLLAAWLLARRSWPGKSVAETLLTLPLVMPPVATGLLLLRLCGRRGPVGTAVARLFGVDLVFTWRSVVLAMMAMSLPLLVRSARTAFEEVPERLESAARLLGAGNFRVFFAVTLPLAGRGIVSGLLLTFARSLGEFGATVLVAGNIPGRTTTISLAIYNAVELGDDAPAFRLVAISIVIAFAAVAAAEAAGRRKKDRRAVV
jgi:molybdate transport system permease protein